MSIDFSNFSRAGLESGLAGLTPEQLIKIASDAAVDRIRNEQAQEDATHGRVKASQHLVLNTINDIVKVSQVVALVEHGVIDLDDDARGLLNSRLMKASEDAAAIADAVAEGDMAEQQLVAGLIEAAAADPEAAAAMISDAGDDMTAAEVLDAAQDLAEVSMAEERGEGEKTSSAAYARLQKVSSSCSDFTGEVITRMAENLIALSRG
jgi:hypothetical protein